MIDEYVIGETKVYRKHGLYDDCGIIVCDDEELERLIVDFKDHYENIYTYNVYEINGKYYAV